MKLISFCIVTALILFTGCSTSKITTSWKAPDLETREYKKIMVVGLINDNDRRIQEKMENHFVNDLKDLGYQAVSSLASFGPKVMDSLTEEQVLAKMKAVGADAVITIVLLDKEKEKKYIPGKVTYAPYSYYSRFSNYRNSMRQRIYEPGYYVTDTKYFWESNFYDLQTDKLLYSVQTASFDPDNAETLGHEYGLLIVKDMLKNKVLKKIN